MLIAALYLAPGILLEISVSFFHFLFLFFFLWIYSLFSVKITPEVITSLIFHSHSSFIFFFELCVPAPLSLAFFLVPFVSPCCFSYLVCSRTVLFFGFVFAFFSPLFDFLPLSWFVDVCVVCASTLRID